MESLEAHEHVLAISRLVDRWAEENLTGEPDWGPLEKAVAPEWRGGFMWMSRIESEGKVIELYKHGITRRYLNLDQDGEAYSYTASGYVPIPMAEAIDWVFDHIEEMGWTRETDYDDEFIAEQNAAFREAGWTVISSRPMDNMSSETPESSEAGDQEPDRRKP